MLKWLWWLLGFGRDREATQDGAADDRDKTPQVRDTNHLNYTTTDDDSTDASTDDPRTNASSLAIREKLRVARKAIVEEEGDLDTIHTALTLWVDYNDNGGATQEEVDALTELFLVETGHSERQMEVAVLAGVLISRVAYRFSLADSAALRTACFANLAEVGKPLVEVQLMAYMVLWQMFNFPFPINGDIDVLTLLFDLYPEMKRAAESNAVQQNEILSECVKLVQDERYHLGGRLAFICCYLPDYQQHPYVDHRLLSAILKALPWLDWEGWENEVLVSLAKEEWQIGDRDLLHFGSIGRLVSLMEQGSFRNWDKRNPPLELLSHLYLHRQIPLTRVEILVLKDAEPWSVLKSVVADKGESEVNQESARAILRFSSTPAPTFTSDDFCVISEGGWNWPRITIHNSLQPLRIIPRFDMVPN